MSERAPESTLEALDPPSGSRGDRRAERAPESTLEVPGYVIGERLGSGGFGEVFRARREVIDREVAIKVLHAKYSHDPEAVARFIAEARAVNKVSHPGIVEIFDFGKLDDGRHYCVMELIRGTTLRDVLRERAQLPLAEALPILRGIAEAIDAAHAAGIAHRDLKPDNVFVLPDGGVKLIDFGLAKLTTEATAVTQTGSVFGTPLYMSPEQCRGRAADVATDRYSFGALAYHVLVGEPPFSGDALELALHHLHDEPEAPSKRRAELPARVDAVLLALLAKDPAARPASTRVAVDALAGEAALPVPRRRGRKLVAAGVAVVALGAATIAALQLRDAKSSSAWQQRVLPIRADGEAENPSVAADGSFLYRDLSGWWKHDLATGATERLSFPGDNVVHLAQLPDARYVLGDRNGIALYDPETRQLDRRFDAGQPAVSPDGRSIAAWTSERWLVVHDVTTRQTRKLTRLSNGFVQDQPKWSPDGKSILWGRENFDANGEGGGAVVFSTDAADGRTRPLDGAAAVAFTRRLSNNYFEPITFLPDGRIAYCAGDPPELRARALDGGPETRIGTVPARAALCQLVTTGNRVVAAIGMPRATATLLPLVRKPGQILQARSLSSLHLHAATMSDTHVFAYADGRYPTTEHDPARPPDLRAIEIETGRIESKRSCPSERSVTIFGGKLVHVTSEDVENRVVQLLADGTCERLARWEFPKGSPVSPIICRSTWCAAAVAVGQDVIVWRLEPGRPPVELARAHRERAMVKLAVAISPDERQVALMIRPKLYIVSIEDKALRELPWDGMPDAIAWGQDPAHFIVSGQNIDGARGALVQVRVGDGAREQWMMTDNTVYNTLATSPRGDRAVAFAVLWEQQFAVYEPK